MGNNVIELKSIAQIRVRYAETDKMGFVYNGMYLTYFEVGRTNMMRVIGLPYSLLEKEGYQLPLISAHVDFKKPAFFEDELDIEASLKFEYKATMQIHYNIFRGNSTIAQGYTIHSFINAETKKPVKPPKVFINALETAFNNKNMG
ncbi:MAG: acyl-CoA thioesterase [Ignavibacteriae bacterium]|nr:acyl-CoA thioesterase [Ignavibacteriota bacterium]